MGALLRREGLYSSHLSNWRRQQEQALTAQRRGRKVSTRVAQAERLGQLERENGRLREQLEQAHAIIDVQKKIAALLERPVNPSGRN
jgi:transposase-like protein